MELMTFNTIDIHKLKVGDFSLFTKTVSETDVTLYAGISGDFSPIHLNQQFAAQTPYGGRIAHPMLIAAMMGAAIYRLLSPNAVCRSRSFETIAPVYPTDTVTIRAEIESIDLENRLVRVDLMAYNQKREPVLKGTSVEEMSIEIGGTAL